MTNPFAEKPIPELKALVQSTAVCEECGGCGEHIEAGHEPHPEYMDDYGYPLSVSVAIQVQCEACNGTGKHPPLEDTDLEALAAYLCEKWWIQYSYEAEEWRYYNLATGGIVSKWNWVWLSRFYHPTTDPVAAMRLQEKYKIATMPVESQKSNHWWADAQDQQNSDMLATTLCRAITTAALLAELAKREEGAKHE